MGHRGSPPTGIGTLGHRHAAPPPRPPYSQPCSARPCHGTSCVTRPLPKQAKNIFEAVLGADHPKTQQWQQDLFFLINAPQIQKITAAAEAASEDDAHGWWMQQLPTDMDIKSGTAAQDDDEDASGNWWMQNLYDMKT